MLSFLVRLRVLLARQDLETGDLLVQRREVLFDDECELVDLDAVHVVEQGLSFRDCRMLAPSYPSFCPGEQPSPGLRSRLLLTLCQLLQLRHGRGDASPDLSRLPRELGPPRPRISVRRRLFRV